MPRAPGKQPPLFGEPISPAETITSVKPVKGDPSRVSVRIGRRTVAILDERAARDLRLSRGTPWTSELAASVRAAAEETKARRTALRSLSTRARSKKELTDRLTRSGASRATADKIAATMERIGLVDDAAYARELVRSVTRAKPAGRRLLESKLRAKGVDPASAAGAIAEAAASSNPLEDATRLARQRASRLPAALDNRARTRRLLGLLARRGFDSDVASEAVRRALKTPAPDDAD